MLELSRIDLAERAALDTWQAYIASRPDAHCTDLGEWRLLFRELYGITDRTYLARDGKRTVGALSLYHIRSPLLGNMLVTSPFFGYGGLYGESDEIAAALVEQAIVAGRELGVDYVELRVPRQLPGDLERNEAFAEFHLELGASPDETWRERLASNVRQNIRKSRSHPLEARLTSDYRPCYALLRQTLRAHGTPFHGERFFQLLDVHLRDRVRYAEVWHGEQIVAAGVVLRHGDTLLTPYIGSLERFRPMRPNYLQYWAIIEHGHATAARRFDMGRSPRDSTHARFKKKWGCDELAIAYQYRVLDPRRGYRSVSEPSALERLATRVWRRLPLAITGRVGPLLFRYIP